MFHPNGASCCCKQLSYDEWQPRDRAEAKVDRNERKMESGHWTWATSANSRQQQHLKMRAKRKRAGELSEGARVKLVQVQRVGSILLFTLGTFALFQLVSGGSGGSLSSNSAAPRANQQQARLVTSAGPEQAPDLRPQSSQTAPSNHDDEISEEQTISKRSQLNSEGGDDDSSDSADEPSGQSAGDVASLEGPASGDSDPDSAAGQSDEQDSSPLSSPSPGESASVEKTGDEGGAGDQPASDSFEPIHVRPSRHSAAHLGPADQWSRDAHTQAAPILTTTPRPLSQSRRQASGAQPRPASLGTTQPPIHTSSTAPRSLNNLPPASLDLNMGADRMMISRPIPLNSKHSFASHDSFASSSSELPPSAAEPPASSFVGGSPTGSRRQDLYSSPSNQDAPSGTTLAAAESSPSGGSQMMQVARINNSPAQNQQPQQFNQNNNEYDSPTICYTPIALMLVVLITLAISLTCGLCAYLLMKHFKRHRFGK